ncbi:MAG: mandelate racemase [Verrucomicrobiae bacterium]|nr:mandelate racemase [Verrucomicrobiae bacterium]
MTLLPNLVVATSIEKVEVAAYQIPTDFPESDGTLKWNATTLILVTITAGGERGLGYTYGNVATAKVIQDHLISLVIDQDVNEIPAIWCSLIRQVRNDGTKGISAMAISAIDIALWDLKAKLLNLPLVHLLGQIRKNISIYGSGGFTSYSLKQLEQQLSCWIAQGISCVKMKVGRYPEKDKERVATARHVIGPKPRLFVDANNAYQQKEALHFLRIFSNYDISWMEQPLSHDNFSGMRWLRDQVPEIEIAEGEYGYELSYFRQLLESQAVDVVMADVTRCLGITGFLKINALCEAYHSPLSCHCAPSLHVHLGCALPQIQHIEYFHDHSRIEHMLFDGVLDPVGGTLTPDLSQPGLGLTFKHTDAIQYAISS